MNPFRVLNIPKGVDKRDVIQAAAAALRERKFSCLEIAAAQKQLLDPESKVELEFLYFADSAPPSAQIPLPFAAGLGSRVEDMKRLEIFDE